MIRYKEEVAAATAELSQAVSLDEQLQTMDRYVATAAQSLRAADTNDVAKREFLRRLGVCAAFSYDRAKKYVDWSIIAPNNLSERLTNQRAVSGDTWFVANSSPVRGSAFMMRSQPAPYGGAYVVHKSGDGEV